MELLSVIVPVYNSEKYLVECLDSILSSTYTNLEVIVVDDGSPDRCPQICDLYEKKDSRVKVIHQENKGLVGARNAGLAVATGKYVGFVDSDDMVSPIMYERLVEAMEQSQADIATCEYSNDRSKLITERLLEKVKLTYIEPMEQQLSVLTKVPSIRNITWTSCYVWNKLYRSGLIKVQFNQECLMAEDLRFNWDYIHNSSKMVVVPITLYFYRLNDDSITGEYRVNRSSPKNMAKGIADAQQWIHIAYSGEIHEKKMYDYVNAHAAYVAHGALWRIYHAKKETMYPDFVNQARKIIKQNYGRVVRERGTYSLFLRFMCWMCAKLFPLWVLAARVSVFVRN